MRFDLRNNSSGLRPFLVSVCLLSAFFFAPLEAFAQQPTPGAAFSPPAWPEMDGFARELAGEIEKDKLKLVFVVGTNEPSSTVSDLEIELRDFLSDSLASQAHDFRVINGAAIRGFLMDSRISERMLYSSVLADLIANHGHADAYLTFRIDGVVNDRFRLTAEIHTKAKQFESIGEFKCEFGMPDLWPIEASGGIPPTETMPRAGEKYEGARVGNIECIYCPHPDIPPKDRRKGLKGAVEVLLGITVRPDGRAYDVFVLKSAGHGYDASAVEAVLRWNFKPAQTAGHPIAATTEIQIIFDVDN